MAYEQMKLVPKPRPEATVIAPEKGQAVVGKGKGNYNFVCGYCESLLAEKVRKNRLVNVIILCPNCGQYNAEKQEKEKSAFTAVLIGCLVVLAAVAFGVFLFLRAFLSGPWH